MSLPRFLPLSVHLYPPGISYEDQLSHHQEYYSACEISRIMPAESFLKSDKIKPCSGRHFGTVASAQGDGSDSKLDPPARFAKLCKICDLHN